MIFITRNENNYRISGDTFSIKETLKNLGAYWNSTLKIWTINCDKYSYEDLGVILHKALPEKEKIKTLCLIHGSNTHPDYKCPHEIERQTLRRKNFCEDKIGCLCKENYCCYQCAVACCSKAHSNACVCKVSTWCSEHGVQHFGTHD